MDDEMNDAVASADTSIDSVVSAWRERKQEGTLHRSIIQKIFQQYCGDFLECNTTDDTVYCGYNDDAAKRFFINILQTFIFDDDPDIALNELGQEGNTTGVCGKIFKSGDPTYFCRECGVDSTCVLCITCFKKSEHRFHKYKISTSSGGGCCDCGDDEAWKKDAYCEDHIASASWGDSQNTSESKIITSDVISRCKDVFTAVLSYSMCYLHIEPSASLKCLDGPLGTNKFCTILYNDESHTFDQVIQTLTKNAKCRHKNAVDMVAAIDREGRAIVKIGTFKDCTDLKAAIESQSGSALVGGNNRQGQPLRSSVLHVHSVAAQHLSLVLLNWLQEFLQHHYLLRRLFADLVQDSIEDYSIGKILERDYKLWKTARTTWHRLIISGLLREYENKLSLAREFSKRYVSMVSEFLNDDHDYGFSVISLTVQLFTVPSIAHNLIGHDGLLEKILRLFSSYAIEPFVRDKVLHFSKNTNTTLVFRRSTYILYDLRYLLGTKPESWNYNLRVGFMDGVKVLLNIMSAMQGMECMSRQTGQHMDYEPEWECAFNLHIKLANTITQIIDWAGSDIEAQLKLCQMTLRNIAASSFILPKATTKTVKCGAHTAECLGYDVSTEPVSVHLPLTRFFAGLYLNLARLNLSYADILPSMDFKLTPRDIIEPVLCTAVLYAQANAGMWRRNGYSVVHQLYFYRNVRCRTEMFDRDIICLQIGASLIESNEFLLHLLNKFNLIRWVNPESEPNIAEIGSSEEDTAHQINVIDEFLELLIIIIGERWVPGISHMTDADRYKKEVIQLLSVRSYSHSELTRFLPETSSETALDNFINDLATFQRPQNRDTRGVYVLKDEFYDEFNLFFYHFVREERSAAELKQIERKKAKKEYACCTPPKLPKLLPAFKRLNEILDSHVFLSILLAVIDRARNPNSKDFNESHIQKVLHLIGYAMQEEMSKNYNLKFFERANQLNILHKLEELKDVKSVSTHRDMLLWTIKKWRDYECIDTPLDVAEPSSDAAAEHEKEEKATRARLAAERRAVIMQEMSKAQNKFMQTNQHYFTEEASTNSVNSEANMEWETEDEIGASGSQSSVTACLGANRSYQKTHTKEEFNCILCHENKADPEDLPFVCQVFVQKSRVLCDKNVNSDEVHTGSCGHVMHYKCWLNYYNSEEARDLRRPHRHRTLFHNQQSTEFICSYCRGLSNAVIPVGLPLSSLVRNNANSARVSFSLDTLIKLFKTTCDNLKHMSYPRSPVTDSSYCFPADVLMEMSRVFSEFPEFKDLVQKRSDIQVSKNWMECFKNYITAGCIAANAEYESSMSQLTNKYRTVWKSVSYTIESVEMCLRVTNKPLSSELTARDRACLSNLVRSCSVFAAAITNVRITKHLAPQAYALLQAVFYNDGPSLLQWNCFEWLIKSLYTVPNALFLGVTEEIYLLNGSLLEFYLLEIFYVANIIKAILLYEHDEEAPMDMGGADEVAGTSAQNSKTEINIPEHIKSRIIDFYRENNFQAVSRKALETTLQYEEATKNGTPESAVHNLPPIEIKCDDHVIASLLCHVKKEMKQFLRSCCIFFYFVTDIDIPIELDYPDADEHEVMCQYLGLNSDIESYLNSESTYASLIDMWVSHDLVKKYNSNIFTVTPCARDTPKLVQLPYEYGDLINNISNFNCPSHQHDEMKTPSMCLICGAIICGQSFCCQTDLGPHTVGACTSHADKCGAEVGIFLRIRECQFIYLGRGKGCYIDPPYLDEYGEIDQNLRRGNPLYLCDSVYNKIYMKWLNHQLHEEIARQNESVNYSFTQWQHM